MLQLSALSKSYHGVTGRQVLSNIDLTVQAGDYIAVMGESGVGKSTLLNLIAGLDKPDGGRIELDGSDMTRMEDHELTRLRRARMGFVFQAFHILPHLSVAQNVALPLLLNGVAASASAQRVSIMLDAVGLAGRERSMPRELSGGESQRVAVARALVHQPAVVLADEPTGNLDPDSAAQVLTLLREQIKRCNAIGILVTHSTLAAATTDRVYLLTRDGLQPR